MAKLVLLIFIIVMGAFGLLAVSNHEQTSINIPFDKTYDVSKSGLILVSSAMGAFLMLIVFVVRDTRRFLLTYQFQRNRKREERIDNRYSKAMNAILAEDEAGARSALEGILKEDHEHTGALLRLGDLDLKRNEFQSALENYRSALAMAPRSLEVLFSIVTAHEKLHRRTDALRYIDDILEIDPDNLNAHHRKRSIIEAQGRWEDVLDLQKKIIKYEHDEKQKQKEQALMLGYRYEVARELLEKGEAEKALKSFRAILKDDKDFIPAYLGTAEAMHQIEPDSEEAVEFLEKGYEQTSSHIILARLEDLLINVGEPSRLIKAYRAAIVRDPKNEMLKFFLAKLYYRLEMIDDAFGIMSALEIAEPFPEFSKLMGQLYIRRGQFDKAAEEFKKSLDLKRAIRVPYCCSACGQVAEEWSGRCPGCGGWNTYKFKLYVSCKI